MEKSRIFFAIASIAWLSVFLGGCAGKRVNLDPGNPVYKPKNDFELNYGFLITPEEREKGYTVNSHPVLSEPVKPFDEIDTLSEFQRFERHFWDIRDTDPNTLENEFKIEKDRLIVDIQNEVLLNQGVMFKVNGGLRGDLARVYLLHGRPNCLDCIQKLSGNSVYEDLMVWYYFDQFRRERYRFLFYDKYGSFRVFKNHNPMLDIRSINPNYLFDPLSSPLREISAKIVTTYQDLVEIWDKLRVDDPGGIFLTALFQFSDYSDVVIEGGDGKKKFGALDPPEPAALTAKRFKPVILGQPDDLTGREFINSAYHSFIPAILRMGTAKDTGKYTFSFLFKNGNLDWEIKGDKEAECLLSLRVSFQNKTSKEMKEFLTGIKLALSKEYLEKNKMTAKEYLEKNKNNYFPVFLDQLSNANLSSPGKLADLAKELKPGTYVVNVDLRHMVTKKSAGGWREEITVK